MTVLGLPITILFVEDVEDAYILTRDMLAQIPGETYILGWVSTFVDGLAAARLGRHDIYLFDYRLGVDSGLDLLRILRSEGCRAPILMLTGQGDLSVDRSALQAGGGNLAFVEIIGGAGLDRALRHACTQKHMAASRDGALAEAVVAQNQLGTAAQLALGALDAVPEQIAVLDKAGVILAVNSAWREFGSVNGVAFPSGLIGGSYLTACAEAAAAGNGPAGQTAAGIADVLSGRTVMFELEYSCHTSQRDQRRVRSSSRRRALA